MSPRRLHVFTEYYNVLRAFAIWHEVCLTPRFLELMFV